MKSAALVVLAAGLAATTTVHASGVEAGKWSFSAFGGVDMPTSGDVHGGAIAPVPDLGPLNPDLLAAVEERVAAYRAENDLSSDVRVPVDAVTASGSGLDPHISVANATLQAARVAEARGLTLAVVMGLIDDHTDGRSLGVLGEPQMRVV